MHKNLNNLICFVKDRDFYLYNKDNNYLTIHKNFFPIMNWQDRILINNYYFLIEDDLNIQYFDLKNIFHTKCFLGKTIPYDIINNNISIRNDLIDEILNGCTLLSNDKFVFIIDTVCKKAKVYPQSKLFKEGPIHTYLILRRQIQFCIIQENSDTFKFLIKCFKI